MTYPPPVAWAQSEPSKSLQRAKDLAAGRAGLLVEKTPLLPQDGDFAEWFVQRHYDQTLPDTDDETKRQWRCAQEDLRVAQVLLASPERIEARKGLALANQLALLSLGTWHAPDFAAEVMASQVIPHLDLALVEEWRSLSRCQLLQNAFSAFSASGRPYEARQTLMALIKAGQEAETLSYCDWARYHLAYLQADNGQFVQAIQTLQAIKGENFQVSVRTLIATWKEKIS